MDLNPFPSSETNNTDTMAMATTATDLLPTPSVTPPPPVAIPELPVQINTVTRKHHIELNRLIIDRLPLALPPIANKPKVYALGLAAFAHIYLAFEQAFDDLERSQDDSVATNGEEEAGHQRKLKAWLANLRPPGLKRSSRIKRDLQYLPQLDRSNFSGLDGEIQSDIRDLAAAKPHILVAYTWVMYMAIFSGGRWIRSQLAGAQPEFWTSHTNAGPALAEKTPLGMPGFSFLSFDGDEDGEDIKVEYKRRLAEGEEIVSTQEREEIMDAAQELFERCISIVHKLDEEVRKQELMKRILPLAVVAAVVTFALAYYRFRH
jgi:heme oxygenase